MKMKTVIFESMPRSTLLATLAGFIGAVLWFTGVSLAVVSFNHHNATPYSFLNHAASELGFPGASSMTWGFNGAMAIGGVALLCIHYALGVQLRAPIGYAAVGYGFGASLALSGLGLFGLRQDFLQSPYVFLQFLNIHLAIAGVFFFGWLVTVTLFTTVCCLRWKDSASRRMALMGIFCSLVAATFLISIFCANPEAASLQKDFDDPAFMDSIKSPTTSSMLTPWLDSHRPSVWWLAVMEWSVIWSMLLWHGMALVFLWTNKKEPAEYSKGDEKSLDREVAAPNPEGSFERSARGIVSRTRG